MTGGARNRSKRLCGMRKFFSLSLLQKALAANSKGLLHLAHFLLLSLPTEI